MSALRYQRKSEHGIDSLVFSFDSCIREPCVWKEEIYAAARVIANRANKPIWVCSSGDLDSEIVCRAFFDQGIHFSVLTIEHATGTNHRDIKYAIEWCRVRGVRQKIVKVDMQIFFTKEVDVYADRYVAEHPFRYFQIKLMEIVEEMGGYAVLAGGEQVYVVDQSESTIMQEDVSLLCTVGTIAPIEWYKDRTTEHEPHFYFRTPELCLSFMRLPLVAFALNNPESVFRHSANAHTFKRLVYQSIWTDIEIRYKSDGFEKIRSLEQDAIRRMRRRFGSKLVTYRLPVTVFERQLTGYV